MNLNRVAGYVPLILYIALTPISAFAQTYNLLLNPNADDGESFWDSYGDVTVEETDDGNWHFVVRNQGSFFQDVTLPYGSIGKYVLMIGRTSSDRINADGAITGLPYLYGFMMEGSDPKGGRIKSYLQGQDMLCWAKNPDEWVTVSGIFEVPSGTGTIRFFLNQAERMDLPQDGSAARFDDLGLYLFGTEEEAIAFIQVYDAQYY